MYSHRGSASLDKTRCGRTTLLRGLQVVHRLQVFLAIALALKLMSITGEGHEVSQRCRCRMTSS